MCYSYSMRKRLAVVALLAWIPLCGQPSRGQAPAKRKDTSHEPKQQSNLATPDTRNNQRGTQDSPLIVETHPRAKSEEDATEAENDKRHAANVERWMLIFTGAAALFTGLLVIVGWRGVNAANNTLGEIGEQTRATRDNIAAYISSERAWVVIFKTYSAALMAVSSGPGVPRPYNAFRFTFKNGGKTVARLMEFNGEPHFVPRNYVLPRQPSYAGSRPVDELKFQYGGVLTPEETLDAWISIDRLLIDASDVQSIQNGDKVLYVWGFLRYLDFSKKERKLQFCYQYVNQWVGWKGDGSELEFKPQWIVAGPRDYNTHT